MSYIMALVLKNVLQYGTQGVPCNAHTFGPASLSVQLNCTHHINLSTTLDNSSRVVIIQFFLNFFYYIQTLHHCDAHNHIFIKANARQ